MINAYIPFIEMTFMSQEMKKMQGQVIVEHETAFNSRPGTSSRQISSRSINGGFTNTSPSPRRHSLNIQQSGNTSINSTSQGISHVKEARKTQGQRRLPRPGFSSQFREETASVVSTFSGPLSPEY